MPKAVFADVVSSVDEEDGAPESICADVLPGGESTAEVVRDDEAQRNGRRSIGRAHQTSQSKADSCSLR